MAKTLAQILLGEDMEGGEVFCDDVYNNLKNHFRADYGGTPCATLTEQLGMIISDAHDDHLYHVTTGPVCTEIIQGDISITDGVAIVWGNTPVAGNSSIEYDEAQNDAIIWGIPVAAERGVIICRMADIAIDFTPEITASVQAVFWFIDADTDSYLGVGHQADDRPGIWSGPDDSKILAIQYEANADVTFFENSGAGENRYVYLYGWDGATARWGNLRVDPSGVFIIDHEIAGKFRSAGNEIIYYDASGWRFYDNIPSFWGDAPDSSMRYDETTNDALIFGLPLSGTKRGLIICDQADVGVNFTSLIPVKTEPYIGIVDIDNDSVFEYGFYADDVGLLTVPANPLRENMIMNSGFGVWSQSDTDKGLSRPSTVDSGSTVPTAGETVTGATSGATGIFIWMDNQAGDWGGPGTGTGDLYLGRCAGRFQDNEDLDGSVSGANFCTVNMPEAAQGCDLITNGEFEGTNAGWAAAGGGVLTISVGGGQIGNHLIVTNGVLGFGEAYQDFATVVGKIYRVTIYFKKGTAGNGMIHVGPQASETDYMDEDPTDVAWTAYTTAFEATTVTTRVALYNGTNTIGHTSFFDEISLYEITPCCTAAGNLAPDGWFKESDLDIYRQHNDATYTRDGSFYSMRVIKGVAGIEHIYQPGSAGYNIGTHLANYAGRIVTLGAWVYSVSATDNVMLAIYHGGAWNYSASHAGAGAWEWMELTQTINAASTIVAFGFLFDGDAGDIAYISQPMLVFGASIGEGNYRPRQQETIECDTYILSNLLNGLLAQSDTAYTTLNLEADTDGKLPKGSKVVWIHSRVNDSGSAGIGCYLMLRKDATSGSQYANSPSGVANDSISYCYSKQACSANGDFDYIIEATGPGTFDVVSFYYQAVQVN